MGFVDENVRPPQVAGSFYPGNADRLRREVGRLLDEAPDVPVSGEIVAALAPHAGYVYSAAIAAPVFKALSRAKFDTAVIIGHDFGRQAAGLIGVLCRFSAFRTPLGDVPVDQELCQALHAADRRLIVNDEVHRHEHSIEVQLPFLQLVAPNCKIVPVLFGEVTADHCRRLAELLWQARANRRILVLSSSDLSHYPDDETARKLDEHTVDYARRFDVDGLCAWQQGGAWESKPGVETPICSAGGLGTALCWSRLCGASRAVVGRQGNSGDASGDCRRVVGYASMVFAKETRAESGDGDDFTLTDAERGMLLKLARRSIADGLAGRHADAPSPLSPALQRPSAVFVTLHQRGQLRGCIGTTAARIPLWQAVSEYACAAAFEDPRFPSVTSAELPGLHIEISVLSPMRRINDPREIIPGRHGVTVRQGHRCGLFLPQVWEQLPDMDSFMGYLCAEKAGLPWDAWRSPQTILEVFTVCAFEEEATR